MADKICLRCGLLKYHEAKGLCKMCYRQQPYIMEQRERYRATPEATAKRRIYSSVYRSTPERKEKQRIRARIYRYTHKEELNAYAREYQNRPYVKAKQKKYAKKYYAQQHVIKRTRELQRTRAPNYVKAFYSAYYSNIKWRKEGLEKMSELFAEVTCGLTGKDSCDLQEKILERSKK